MSHRFSRFLITCSATLITVVFVVGCDGGSDPSEKTPDEPAAQFTTTQPAPGSASRAQRPTSTEPTAPSSSAARPQRSNPESVDGPVMTPGHDRMLEILNGIAHRSRDENPFFGDYLVRELQDIVDPMTEKTPFVYKWSSHMKLGHAQMNFGNLPAALEQFNIAYQMTLKDESKAREKRQAAFSLGVAHMCMAAAGNDSPESRVLPISKGFRERPENLEAAIKYFSELLNGKMKDRFQKRELQWLVNYNYMAAGRYPQDVPKEHLIPPKAFESKVEFPRFVDVAPRLDLDTLSTNGGVIIDDFNLDGFLDIVTSTWDPAGQIRFVQNNGDGSFSDRSVPAGLKGIFGGLNLVQGDYDNDGYLDILVLRGGWWGLGGQHPNSLIRNNGDGTFMDVTFEAGLGAVHYPSQSAAWADYDQDGDLDLYVGNESQDTVLRAPCQLFRNNGDGTFTDVAAQAGVENLRSTKGVAWGDYDGDRDPDLCVSNYHGTTRLYRNNGDGTFTDVARDLEVLRPIRGFPCWFWDFDNDGALDLGVTTHVGLLGHVASYFLGKSTKAEHPCLYRGDGHGKFRDVADEQSLVRPLRSTSANFGDLNGDGHLDLYVGTGVPEFGSPRPNVMYLNRGGDGFDDVTMAGGFANVQKGNGIAFADLDNDGDLDVFQQMGGAYRGASYRDVFYENPGFGHQWIRVQLVGVKSNSFAIGARIHLQVDEDGKTRSIYRHVTSGGSYGANPLRQTIGLGNAKSIQKLEVFWPTTGETQVFEKVSVNQTIQLTEGEERFTKVELRTFRLTGK